METKKVKRLKESTLKGYSEAKLMQMARAYGASSENHCDNMPVWAWRKGDFISFIMGCQLEGREMK